ncbi:hypothetical protein [Roseicyclus elongatus]|uniref:hypothetical protein n=1 Tax=Roseicyclus elongatus TaxID=159346 RepID=UPI0012EC0803|nr:hypothetical protein [Roseibacterium elongatum]
MIVAATSIMLPSISSSQEVLSGTPALEAAVSAFYEGLNGSETQISGAIGTLFGGDRIYFADGTGRYRILLDAGRNVRRDIEGCELELFETLQSPCQIEGTVELSIDDEDDNLADGIEIEMILFSVESFTRSE